MNLRNLQRPSGSGVAKGDADDASSVSIGESNGDASSASGFRHIVIRVENVLEHRQIAGRSRVLKLPLFFAAEFSAAAAVSGSVNFDAVLLDDEELAKEKLKVLGAESDGGNLLGAQLLNDAGRSEYLFRREKRVVVKD